MRPKRPIALKALELGLANVGVLEVGNNRGAAVEAYQASCVPPLKPGDPWCAAVQRFRLKQACNELNTAYDTTFPRSGYTPDYSAWGKANDKWISVSTARNMTTEERKASILPGDYVLFYFKQLGRIAHVGQIISVHSWGVWTLEGNTSPEPSDALEVERDGDGYFKKKRNWSELGQYGGILMLDF